MPERAWALRLIKKTHVNALGKIVHFLMQGRIEQSDAKGRSVDRYHDRSLFRDGHVLTDL